MNPSNHTPGPYPLTVTKVDEFFLVVTNQGNHFAKTFDPCAARLILASPELLRALEGLVSDWERVTGRSLPDDHEAKAAIAKAKGSL